MIDFDSLSERLEKAPTVSARQHYAVNLLRNPRTSPQDRRRMLAYIRTRPDLFVPYSDWTGSPVENEIARKKNGPDARYDFRTWVEIRFASRACPRPSGSHSLERG